jgi:hypothetical protein
MRMVLSDIEKRSCTEICRYSCVDRMVKPVVAAPTDQGNPAEETEG